MSSNMKIGLLTALVLATCGATSAAMAGGRDDDLSASAAQVEQEWLQGQHRLLQNHMGNGGAVYDYIGTTDRTQSRRSR
jgi:hypothetical protein